MEATQERYQRQMILPELGQEGQTLLSKAKVLVIGAGGLGCPVLQYLVVAGVGHIGIVDDDIVQLSNLNRQILFSPQDVGLYKVDVAKEKLILLNDSVSIHVWRKRWSTLDCINHFKEYDVIVDATDNFASRYLINDACVLLNKPLVFGAVSKFEGQLAVFNWGAKEKSVNYRDVFPVPPRSNEILNCAEAGVLGVLPGIIGLLQATEVIKLITGIGKPLVNKLLTYNALQQDFFTIQLKYNPEAKNLLPSSIEEFENTNYEWLCNLNLEHEKEIDCEKWLEIKDNLILVDVRELKENPRLDTYKPIEISISDLRENRNNLPEKPLVFVCQSGKRSLLAVKIMLQYNPKASVYSLKGGVNEMMKKNLI
jgi:sulfur-carrier protein adenylyltransferase/sulfurtransferase